MQPVSNEELKPTAWRAYMTSVGTTACQAGGSPGAQAAGGLPRRLAVLALAAIASAQGSYGGVQVYWRVDTYVARPVISRAADY
jgi:hypothetical protein